MNDKAQQSVRKFFQALAERNFEKMYSYCQITWQINHKKKELAQLFDNFHISIFDIEPLENTQAYIFDFRVDARAVDGSSIVFPLVRVIPESAPYKPDLDGVYGVNPISAIRTE